MRSPCGSLATGLTGDTLDRGPRVGPWIAMADVSTGLLGGTSCLRFGTRGGLRVCPLVAMAEGTTCFLDLPVGAVLCFCLSSRLDDKLLSLFQSASGNSSVEMLGHKSVALTR